MRGTLALLFIFGIIGFFVGAFSDLETLKIVGAFVGSISGIILMIWGAMEAKENAEIVREILDRKIGEITKSEDLTGEKYESMDEQGNIKVLTISEEQSAVAIINIAGNIEVEKACDDAIIQRINFDDIVEVKVNSDSSTITSTSRGSQLGGAIVGGVLAGGAGAIIGGLSGKTKSSESMKKLVLEIVVNSISNPVIEIPFYDSTVELKARTPQYEEVTQAINLWYRKFTVILHQQDQKQAQL